MHRDRSHGTEGSQCQAFGDELANDALTARAERHAQRHFGPAGRAAGQKQVGEVRAGDEQQHSDGDEQRGQ